MELLSYAIMVAMQLTKDLLGIVRLWNCGSDVWGIILGLLSVASRIYFSRIQAFPPRCEHCLETVCKERGEREILAFAISRRDTLDFTFSVFASVLYKRIFFYSVIYRTIETSFLYLNIEIYSYLMIQFIY